MTGTRKAYVLQLARSTFKCLTCGERITSKRAAMKHECKDEETSK